MELRREGSERGLQAFDEILALVVGQRERRFDRGAEIPRGLFCFLEREIFRLGPPVNPLDQLVDPLHLLTQRLFRSGFLRLGAFADRRLRGGIALLDAFVQAFAFFPERLPFT